MDPDFWRVYLGMAFAHAAKGDLVRAISALEQGQARFRAGSSEAGGPLNPWLGYLYAVAGRRKEALEVLTNLEARAQAREGLSTDLAIVHLGLGNKERALELLEKGYTERPADITLTGPLYILLKDEPRYQAILRNMGLHLTDSPLPVSEKSKPTFARRNRE